MTRQSLVIIGNGMATGRLLDELLLRDRQKYTITVIGDEPHGSYNRIMLSAVLSGEADNTSIVQKPLSWYQQNTIAFWAGVRVVRIDRKSKKLTCSNNKSITYDQLIIATGSRPATIPAKNQQLRGILAFRTLDDVDRLVAASAGVSSALVVGGGLLGLEAAYGLACRGLKVTLVHRSPWLLNRQLDQAAGKLLQQVMKEKGIEFRLAAEIEAFHGAESVSSAALSSGEVVPCELAVIATGITPNAELGLASGLAGKRGIAVDDYLTTSDEAVSALGECVEYQGLTFGLVEPIWRQCRILADRLMAEGVSRYVNEPVATKLKVSGVQLFSAGEVTSRPNLREVVMVDRRQRVYRKLLLEGGIIKGVVLFGDVRDGQHYFDLLRQNQTVPSSLPNLLMGAAFVEKNSCAA